MHHHEQKNLDAIHSQTFIHKRKIFWNVLVEKLVKPLYLTDFTTLFIISTPCLNVRAID